MAQCIVVPQQPAPTTCPLWSNSGHSRMRLDCPLGGYFCGDV